MGKVVGLAAALSSLVAITGCGDGGAAGNASGSGADGGMGAISDAGDDGGGKSGSSTGATSNGGSDAEPNAGAPSDATGGSDGAGAAANDGGMPGNPGGMPGNPGGAPGKTEGGAASGDGGTPGTDDGGSPNAGAPTGSAGSPDLGECDNQPSGAPCGDQTASECDEPDTCQRGVCSPNYVDPGKECGKPSDNECDAPSQCDGAGECAIEFQPPGTPCGDQQKATTCDALDTCDGSGSCEPNLADFGIACGNNADTACDNPDYCDGDGNCDYAFEPKGKSCGNGSDTACDNPDSCDGAGACLLNREKAGTACGSSADTACDNPDKCNDAGGCEVNNEPPGTPCGSESSSDCSSADTCSAGVCQTNDASDGSACEDCAAGVGQCGGCSQGGCSDSQLCEMAPSPLSTGYATNANQQGIMFDMAAAEELTLRGFDVNLLSGTHTVEIYVTTSATTHVGNETNANAWTLLESYSNVTGTAAAGATALPKNLEYTLAAGTSRGFYIRVVTDLLQRMFTGSSVGAVQANDGVLQINEGIGKGSGGFAGIGLSPRKFSGSVHYTRSITTTLAGGNAIDGVMFDVDAANDVRIRGLQVVPAGSGDFDVELWYRKGTHVGHESNSADWQLVDMYASVPMVGGEPLRLPIVTDMIFEAGSTHGLYITTEASGSLRAILGSAVGTALETDGNLTVREGTGKVYPFGLSHPNRQLNATIEYDTCAAP
jgi:hypothetical protein